MSVGGEKYHFINQYENDENIIESLAEKNKLIKERVDREWKKKYGLSDGSNYIENLSALYYKATQKGFAYSYETYYRLRVTLKQTDEEALKYIGDKRGGRQKTLFPIDEIKRIMNEEAPKYKTLSALGLAFGVKQDYFYKYRKYIIIN